MKQKSKVDADRQSLTLANAIRSGGTHICRQHSCQGVVVSNIRWAKAADLGAPSAPSHLIVIHRHRFCLCRHEVNDCCVLPVWLPPPHSLGRLATYVLRSVCM